MPLQYSTTKFGTTFSTAYVKETKLVINFGRTETTGYAEYVIRPNSSNNEVMETRLQSMEFSDISTTDPETQVYNYLTGSVAEFSGATVVS